MNNIYQSQDKWRGRRRRKPPQDGDSGDGAGIHALYAAHERMTARVRAFVDFPGTHVQCDFGCVRHRSGQNAMPQTWV